MSELTVNLRKWADTVESCPLALAPSEYITEECACIKGMGLYALGYRQLRYSGGVQDWLNGALAPLGITGDFTRWPNEERVITAVERRIVAEVRRLKGAELELAEAEWIDNLVYRLVDRITFARAIRTVARQLEEEEAGDPIEAVVASGCEAVLVQVGS